MLVELVEGGTRFKSQFVVSEGHTQWGSKYNRFTTGIIIVLEYAKCGTDNVINAVHLPPAVLSTKKFPQHFLTLMTRTYAE